MHTPPLQKTSGNTSPVSNQEERKGRTLPAVPAFQNNPVQKKELEEEEPLQGKFPAQLQGSETAAGLLGEDEPVVQKKENNTGLPVNLKEGVENLSGIAMDDVRVHYNSDKPAQLQALAYAQGTDIHVGPGQEKHLPHEAWHVVQQKQGRVQPTMQMKGGVAVNDDKGLEEEADVMGGKSIQFIDERPKSVQMKKLVDNYSNRQHSVQLRTQNSASISFKPVIQRANMFVLIGTPSDQNDLNGNTISTEKDLNLKAEQIATANLGSMTEVDTLYLGGAHGNSSSFGPYTRGKDLSDTLFDRGLRICKAIILTGCETGNGFSKEFYDAALLKKIDIKGYMAAPKTLGIVREEGRIVAFTSEQTKILELEKDAVAVFKKDPFDPRVDEIQSQINVIRKNQDFWEYIENPIQMAEELKEKYDDLDRYYNHYTNDPTTEGMPYSEYEKQFNTLKKVSQLRLEESINVWKVHAKPEVIDKFKEIRERKPVERKIWDLSGIIL